MALYLVGLGLVSVPRSFPVCPASSTVDLGWVPDPMFLFHCFLPMALSQPRPGPYSRPTRFTSSAASLPASPGDLKYM